MYYEIWQQFDPDGTQYIKYNQLSDFLDVLEPPLQIHKPNKYKIISMDIPICKGDLCYCVDVLDALTKDFFARKGNPVEETAELGEVTAHADRPEYEPISSTPKMTTWVFHCQTFSSSCYSLNYFCTFLVFLKVFCFLRAITSELAPS